MNLNYARSTVIMGLIVLCLVGCHEAPESNTSKNQLPSKPLPPVAKKIDRELVSHQHTRIDPYYWMRDDERKDPEILAHLSAENEYTDKMMAHTQPLQDKLYDEITNRIKKDDTSVPTKQGSFYYYVRFEGEQEYPIYARKKDSLTNQESILLDGNLLAKGHDYFNIGDFAISTNENLMAFSIDTLSRRIYTIQIKDLQTGELLNDKIEGTSGEIVWANDNKTLFYVHKDPQTLLGYQVFRHTVGTDQSKDVLVYNEDDNTFYTSINKTKDESLIYINHRSTTRDGASILDANKPDSEFKLFSPMEENLEYHFEKLDDSFYVLTNWQANNFQIIKVSQQDAHDKTKWLPIVPHDPTIFIEDLEVLKNHLLLREKINGKSRVRAINLTTNRSHELKFEDPVFVTRFSGNTQIDTPMIRLSYSSMTTPMSTFDYNLHTGERTLLKQEEVLGDFKPGSYTSERFFIIARDGASVPVTLVYRNDLFKKDGTNPLYQYGYGSYGATMEPYFSPSRLSLLDRGFVFAIAHIRGSQMLGRPWYEAGKMMNKKNTFTDFIDVTKSLVEQKYAAKDKVFASGGSAGGLLMGAVINMAPELYRGVSAHVPFVDVVTTMLDESIPLTTNEYDEWGNPNQKDAFEYMLSYSPYDQITAQNYPNLLVTTGLHDSQVQYFEPAKWVAKLRDIKSDDNLLLFHINMEAGHGGASGRFRRNKERALEFAFFMDLIGIQH